MAGRGVGEREGDHALLKPSGVQTEAVGLIPDKDASGPPIVASIYYRNSENPNEYGMYSINASNGYMEKLSLNDHIQAMGGGYYDNGIYRFVGSINNSDNFSYYEYDVSNWTMVRSEYLPDLSNTALDVAFDPETGYVYGCFPDAIGTKYMFGYIDYDTHTSVPLSDCGTVIYFGIIATPSGQIYGVASDGNLYSIDKTTGDRQKVGPLGFRPKYNQTAVCDLQSGRAYWLGCNSEGISGLYELNLQTGAARIIRSFSTRDGSAGAFIEQSPWKPSAPEAVSELTVELDGNATDGTISFRMPQTTTGGSILTGSHSYRVFVNNTVFASGQAMPDALVELPASFPVGVLDIRVSVHNDAGAGKVAQLRSFAGFDAPASVRNLITSVTDGNTVRLSWDTPDESKNGGFLDKSDISYRILRYPGALTISSGLRKNEFSQRLSDKKYSVYRYEIIPQSHANAGPSTMSDYVAVGPEMMLPWHSAFDKDGAMTMVAESRGIYGWSHDSENCLFEYTGGEASIFTPAFMLDTDCAYRIVLSASEQSGAQVPLTVSSGKSISHNGSGGLQFGDIVVEGSEFADYESYIYPSDSGRMFLSLSGSASGGACALALRSIIVEEGPSALAPRAVTDVEVTPDPDGQNKAEIRFTLPTQAINGSKLQQVDYVAVYRNGEFIGNATVGAGAIQAVYVDVEAEAGAGETVYELRAVNSAGQGLPCRAKAYVGVDVPMAPTDVKAFYDNGKIRIEWTAPKKGANGGYINPDCLSYLVLNTRKENVAMTEGTTFCIDETDYSGRQAMLQYIVAAVSEAGVGAIGVSDVVVVGDPYHTPFHETFYNGHLDNSYWEIARIGTRAFNLDPGNGCDGEPGCATYKPLANEGEVEASLMSGKIDISSTHKPILQYSYSSESGAATVLSVLVMLPDGGETEVDRIDFRNISGRDGWCSRSLDLSPFCNQPFIRIRFRVCSENGMVGASIDNVIIEEGKEKDLAASMYSLSSMTSGQTRTLTAHIDNFGYADVAAGTYEVSLYKNGREVEVVSDCPALKQFEGADIY
ncbi:MAG: hypothetical protein K2L80_04035, partial [Muribaculaceae bacterium]|nr:hypothetical protein [Muribaculaceae bacterium]